jgi:hypothetical protein
MWHQQPKDSVQLENNIGFLLLFLPWSRSVDARSTPDRRGSPSRSTPLDGELGASCFGNEGALLVSPNPLCVNSWHIKSTKLSADTRAHAVRDQFWSPTRDLIERRARVFNG